jgi:hypothetical protein
MPWTEHLEHGQQNNMYPNNISRIGSNHLGIVLSLTESPKMSSLGCDGVWYIMLPVGENSAALVAAQLRNELWPSMGDHILYKMEKSSKVHR